MATDQELDAIEGKLLAQIEGLRQQLATAQEQVKNAQWAYQETERDLTAMRKRSEAAEADSLVLVELRQGLIENGVSSAAEADNSTMVLAVLEELKDQFTRAERAEAARDELRAALDRAFSDRDYWLEWKKAVPVDAISLLQRNFRPGSLNELQADADIAHWLVKLDADEAQP
jgi:hypothetical protein